MIMFWFGAGLFYANTAHFAKLARTLIDQAPTPIRWFVLDARAVTEVDYSGGRALAELHQDLAKAGIVFALIVVKVRHQGDLERMGLVDLIGADRIFESRYECVAAYRSGMAAMVPKDSSKPAV